MPKVRVGHLDNVPLSEQPTEIIMTMTKRQLMARLEKMRSRAVSTITHDEITKLMEDVRQSKLANED